MLARRRSRIDPHNKIIRSVVSGEPNLIERVRVEKPREIRIERIATKIRAPHIWWLPGGLYPEGIVLPRLPFLLRGDLDDLEMVENNHTFDGLKSHAGAVAAMPGLVSQQAGLGVAKR